jgi:hypothetical protein
MTDEQRQIRQQLNQEFIKQAIPSMPASVQDRSRRTSGNRVDRGKNPADIKVPIPEHLLQQPAPKLPERNPRAFRNRTERTSASKRKN